MTKPKAKTGLVVDVDNCKLHTPGSPNNKTICTKPTKAMEAQSAEKIKQGEKAAKAEAKVAMKPETTFSAEPAKKRVMPKATGYKGHKAGSRKEQVHKLFDEKGGDEAIAKGVELGIQAVTVKLWIREFKKPVTK